MALQSSVVWCLFLVAVAPAVHSLLSPDNVLMNTTVGQLRGVNLDESYAFLGVPFAKPPVGNLRLREPQPMDPWEGIFNATEKSPGCMQVCAQPPEGCPETVR